jgi:alkylation response protein AidB-like acyl-CoA dehydrogenase
VFPTHLDLSPEQALFQETSRKFLEAVAPVGTVRALADDPVGFDRDLWRRSAELGWLGLLVPEKFGGGSLSGKGVIDLTIVANQIGRVVHPGPTLPVNLVASAIATEGSIEQGEELLPRLVAGDAIATWCAPEAVQFWSGNAPVRAQAANGSIALDGTHTRVQDAHVADWLLVVARSTNGFTQVLVPREAPGLRVEPLECLDVARRLANVHLDGVTVPAHRVVGPVDGAGHEIDRLFTLAVVLQAAETVGAIDRVFEFTLEYAKDRVAFGRPIGSYQAIKHRLADLLTTLESCKAASTGAAEALEAETDRAAELASVAKAFIGRSASSLVQECVQIHGGIGVTWEHDIHLYLRRVATNTALYGSPAAHEQRLFAMLEP